MNSRLAEIIDHYTDGKRNEFAERLGWSPSYLSNLLHGKGIGIEPVRTILATFPKVNARWLLFGEGKMLGR